MTYTRILFNNIKEYTPLMINTVPYVKCSKPIIGRKPQVGWGTFKDPRTIRNFRRFKRFFLDDWAMYQLMFFFIVFSLTSIAYYPTLWVYQTNNQHRSMQAAILKEKAHKEKMAALEEEEEEGAEE